MSHVDTLWDKIYKAPLFLFGIPFFVIGVVFLMMDGGWGFLINGVLWIVLGMCIKIKSTYDKRRLESLKREGRSYEGRVVRVLPVNWIRAGSYVTVRVECLVNTAAGDKTVRSGYFLLSPFDQVERLNAKVYFSLNDSEDFAVALFR